MTFFAFLPPTLGWLAGFLDLVASVLLSVTAVRYLRKRTPTIHAVPYAVTLLGGILLIKLGALLQLLVLEAFFSPSATQIVPGIIPQGIMYQLAVNPAPLLADFRRVFFSFAGVLSGTVLGILVVWARCRPSALEAAVYAVSVLVVDDCLAVLGVTLLRGGVEGRSALSGLGASIFCDFAGGWVAGLICYWIAYRTEIIARSRTIAASVGLVIKAVLIGIVLSAALFSLVFFILVYPSPEDVSATLTRVRQLDFVYTGPTFWIQPLDGMHIVGPSPVQIVGGSSRTGAVDIVLTRACPSVGDALNVARHANGRNERIRLRGTALKISTSTYGDQTTLIPSDAAIKTVIGQTAKGTTAEISPERMASDTSFQFGGDATLQMSPGANWSVAVSTGGRGFGLSAQVKQDNSNLWLTQANDVEPVAGCRVVPVSLSTTPPSVSFLNAGKSPAAVDYTTLVMFLPNTNKSMWVDIGSGSTLLIGANGGHKNAYGLPSWPNGLVTQVIGLVDAGSISVGTERYDEIRSLFMVGPLLEVEFNEVRNVTIAGSSNYIVANGSLLTRAIFWQLPGGWQLFLPPAFCGLLLWFLPNIRKTLLRVFRGGDED